MAQAAVHCIKDYRPARNSAEKTTQAENIPPRRAQALASDFYDMEGKISDIRRMSHISAEYAMEIGTDSLPDNFQRLDLLVFTVFKLQEMIEEHWDKFYESCDSAKTDEE